MEIEGQRTEASAVPCVLQVSVQDGWSGPDTQRMLETFKKLFSFS